MTSGPSLTLFGPAHLLAMGIVAVVGVSLPVWVRRRGSAELAERVALALAVLLVVHRLFVVWLETAVYGAPLAEKLPLHLCSVATFLIAVVLVRRTYRVYEVTYFWGLGGAVQALLTPNLEVGFPHPLFFTFLVNHGLIIGGVLYATIVFRMRPRHGSIWRALLVTLAYAALIAPVNVALGANYLFLRQKPDGASLLDHLGPWPWYIPALAMVGLVSFYIYYVPFAVLDLARRRAASTM